MSDLAVLIQEVCPDLKRGHPRATITITEGYQIQIQTWDHHGNGHIRFVSPAELRAVVTDLPSDTGWIDCPGQWQLIRCFSTGGRDWKVVWHPPAQHKLFLLHPVTGRQVEITVPLPALVMVYSGRSGHLWASKLAQPDFKKGVELFKAPLPNVNINGSMCLGAEAKDAFDWWQGVMNSDFTSEKTRGTHSKDIRNKLLAVQGKEAYPLKDLVKADITLEKAIQRLGGQYV